MSIFIEKNRKKIFYAVLILSFLCVGAYNFLTPYLSDDITYVRETLSADSLIGVLKFNINEYLYHNCRFIDQLIMRLLEYTGSKVYANIINSAVFVLLGVLIYLNIDRRKKYDIGVILLIFLFVWKYAVDFGDTVLWIAGASTYLYGIAWILGVVTLYRYMLNTPGLKHPALANIGLLLLGLAAGMANENTSGGCFLLILIFTLNKLLNNKKAGIPIKKSIKPYMFTALISVLLGLILLVFGPGSQNRKGTIDGGNYTGIVGLLSHIYKITLSMRELMWELLLMTVIALVILIIQKKFKSFYDIRNHTGFIYLFAYLASCYAIAVIEPTTNRIYFGGSIFLMIALVQFITDIYLNDSILKIAKYSLISVLCLWFTFNYLDNLVNLARIYREENERIEILQKARDSGNTYEVVVPQYRPQFDNPYTTAYKNDMREDPEYWINWFYEESYGIEKISAIPRDEWDEIYGNED